MSSEHDPRQYRDDDVADFDQDAAVIAHGRSLIRCGIPREVVHRICANTFRRNETDVAWLLAGPVPPAERVVIR